RARRRLGHLNTFAGQRLETLRPATLVLATASIAAMAPSLFTTGPILVAWAYERRQLAPGDYLLRVAIVLASAGSVAAGIGLSVSDVTTSSPTAARDVLQAVVAAQLVLGALPVTAAAVGVQI